MEALLEEQTKNCAFTHEKLRTIFDFKKSLKLAEGNRVSDQTWSAIASKPPPPTEDDMDDIFASLEAEEKKMKKEAKRKAKAEKAGTTASGVVAAKKPKMANAASALPTTNTNQSVTPASNSVAAMAKKPFLPPQMQVR